MTRRALLSTFLLLGVTLALGVGVRGAAADISPKVSKAFAGQILVTDEPLESSGDDKATIADFKKRRLDAVKGSPNGEDVQTWQFYWTAFLKKKGATELSLEFHVDGKFVADRRLTGVDPTLSVLQSEVNITEDDGPAKGKKYTLKLVGKIKGKEVVLATTPLALN